MDAWIEWKKICAINNCNQTTQQILGYLSEKSFNKICSKITNCNSYNIYNKRVSTLDNTSFDTVEYSTTTRDKKDLQKIISAFYEAFARFEIHAITTTNKSINKSYKDWIFIQAQNDPQPLKVIRGMTFSSGKSMMIDVVRQYLKEDVGLKVRKNKDGKKRLVNLNESIYTENDNGITLIQRLENENILHIEDSLYLKNMFEFAEDVVVNKQIELEPELIIALVTEHLSLTRSDPKLLKIIGYARASSFNYLFEKKIPKIIFDIIEKNLKLNHDQKQIIKNCRSNFKKLAKTSGDLKLFYACIKEVMDKYALSLLKKNKTSEKLYMDFLDYIRRKNVIINDY